jgi:hypothetical protein
MTQKRAIPDSFTIESEEEVLADNNEEIQI